MLFIAVVLALGACGDVAGEPASAERAAQTPAQVAERLADALGVLERAEVSVLMNRANCRLIVYSAGSFAAHVADWCVALAPVLPGAFTERADADFDRLVGALDVGRAAFSGVVVDGHTQAGEIDGATFRFSYGFGSELLVFEPGYALPADVPGERWHEPIDDDWYLVQVDWN